MIDFTDNDTFFFFLLLPVFLPFGEDVVEFGLVGLMVEREIERGEEE